MSKYLKSIDGSKNMEALRSARSYNDVVVVLSRIRSAAVSIFNRTSRRYDKVSSVGIPMAKRPVQIDHKAVASLHADINDLVSFMYEVQYAKSKIEMMPSESKAERFRKLLDSTEKAVVSSKNMCYKCIHTIGSGAEPQALSEYASHMSKFLQKSVSYSSLSEIVIPGSEAHPSFTHHFVLFNVKSSSDYVLPELTIAIRAESNYDGTFFYSVSVPNSLHDKTEGLTFSDKRKMLEAVQQLLSRFAFRDVDSVDKSKMSYVESLEGIYSTYVKDGSLHIELESGITGSEINSLLTQILYTVFEAFGVKSRSEVLHKVVVSDKGNKVIQIRLSDRNFYQNSAMGKLKRMLSLSPSTYKQILSIVGNKDA